MPCINPLYVTALRMLTITILPDYLSMSTAEVLAFKYGCMWALLSVNRILKFLSSLHNVM